ncbi:MAG: DUF2127 domain-containing protein [Rhodocyclaceae bacterium]|nr:DUF2127 domain-containing protein [Rhodocyclaceae bacterium]
MNRPPPPAAGGAFGRRAIRAVAAIEALKGAVVLLAASGLLSLVHRDLHAMAAALVAHAHLNPAAHYPRIFVDAASHLDSANLRWLALGAAVYALLRLAEAWGLYRERGWAELLAAASGALYVPVELFELVRRPGWLGVALLTVNLAVVAVMLRALAARRESGALHDRRR